MDYEKGTASWDLGLILTRHETGSGGGPSCARVIEVRRSARMNLTAPHRLNLALAVACTCTMGDSPSEQTSLQQEAKA